MPLNPRKETFHQPASLITSQSAAVLRPGSDPVSLMRRDHLNAFLAQFLVQLVAVVGTITNQILRFGLDHVEKLIQLGAKPVTMSDSGGFIHDPEGITGEKLEWIKELKNTRRGRMSEYADEFGAKYYEGKVPGECPVILRFRVPPRMKLTWTMPGH